MRRTQPDPTSDFATLTWPGLLGLDPSELAALEQLMVPMTIPDGDLFVDAGGTPPGLFFCMNGSLSVSPRLSHGVLAQPLVSGRGYLVGESAAPDVRTLEQRVSGLRGAQGLFLRADRIPIAIAAVPDLAGALRKLGILRRSVVEFANAIRKDPRFSGLALSVMLGLLQTAEIHEYAPGEAVIAAGRRTPPELPPHTPTYDTSALPPATDITGLYMLVSGQLEATAANATGQRVERIVSGMLFGGMATQNALLEPADVKALTASIVAKIPLPHLQLAMFGSPTLRRTGGAIAALARSAEDAAVIYGFLGNAGKPMSAIVRLLAQTAAAVYHDEVVVMRLLVGSPPEDAPRVRTDGYRVRYLDVYVPPTGAWVALTIFSALREVLPADYVLLDESALPEGLHGAFAARIARTVYFTGDTFAPLPNDVLPSRVSWAVQLGEHAAREEPAHYPGTVRLRLDLAAVRRAETIAELTPEDRARLARWWRALSERRVGIALGGGGAWGFMHTTLIRRIVESGIPIDIVSGASFGALCGAFWCVLQDPTFRALEGFGTEANRATRMAFLSSGVLAHKVDRALAAALCASTGRTSVPTPRLEDLEIPLLPVATNIGAGSEAVVSVGTVGWGVRCSSSFPGIFAPTTGRDFRYVDGGIIRNVPTDPLVGNNTDLIIASNIVPNPQFAASRSPMFPGRVGRLLHEFNPFGRVEDIVRSSLILMHTAGEAVAFEADVVYNGAPASLPPSNMENGALIAKAAEPSVEEILPTINAKWVELRDRSLY